MPSLEASIWLALQGRVETLPLSYPKAWPGQVFEPPHESSTLSPYLRIGRTFVTPSRMLIAYGEKHDRRGRLIVTLLYPLGQDPSVYSNLAGKISNHFVDGTEMTYGDVCVTVPEYPHVQAGYEDGGYWATPVNIKWQVFA